MNEQRAWFLVSGIGVCGVFDLLNCLHGNKGEYFIPHIRSITLGFVYIVVAAVVT
jgi:hypothetical protein